MRQRWSSEEEAALKSGIDKYGESNWCHILKDRKFGPILHLRSNVDLKDKWRNMVLMKDEFYRQRVRGPFKNTRKKKKQRSTNLSTVVLRKTKSVVAKPLTVLSGGSEVSELDSIKKPMSRLNKPTVDAITKANRPRRSCQIPVSTYLEKEEEIAGVAGDYPELPQELYEKGMRIEVLTREEGFSDSWYVATVIDPPPPSSYLKRKNSASVASFNKYYVEYETLMDNYDTSCSLKEFVDAQLIRPPCPLRSAGSFQVDDIVDAFYYDGWWIGVITKTLPNSRFEVTFPPPLAEQEFHISEMRLHLDWVDGQWINPRTQVKEKKISELYGDTPKSVKRRGRPPKVHKSLKCGERTAEGIKEKDSETNNFAPISVALTCDRTISPQGNTPFEFSPVQSDTVLSDQNGEENASAGLVTEENMENGLNKQRWTPQEGPEPCNPKSRAEILTEKAKHLGASDKLVKRCSRKLRNRNVNSKSSPLPHSVVGVRTSGRTEERDGETRSPDFNISGQSSLEEFQSVICDHDEENVRARLASEKRAVDSDITVGKHVEVCFEKDHNGVWYPATVLKDCADNSYLVHYMFKNGREVSPHTAIVDMLHLRPQPPQHKNRNFSLLDKVDAFYRCAWASGLIIKEFTDKRFVVSFKGKFKGKKAKAFSKCKLRPHMEWVDGRWIDASKSSEADNDASHKRLSNEVVAVDEAEIPTPTACETETMNLVSSSKQPSTSFVCQTDAVVMKAPGNGQSYKETENRSVENKVIKEKKISELDGDTPKIVKTREQPPIIDKSSINGNESNAGMINSSFLGIKCSLWDCTRPAQGFDYCSNHHAALALKEGTVGMTPVLRRGGTGLKESQFFVILNAKAQGKDVGIPECEKAATAKSPWNAPELFDSTLLEGETMREWLFFDKPRKALKNGSRQLSLPDYKGRGWHGSRKQVVNDFGDQKKAYYMDPQPSAGFCWHLFEYEMFNFDECALYRLVVKRVSDKKSVKGKLPDDSAADLQKQMRRSPVLLEPRSRMEIPTDGIRIAEGTGEKDCEMGDIASILIGFTNNGTKSPQDNIPCQSPVEESQTFTSGQENLSARLVNEESTKNCLRKQRGLSPEPFEPRSRIEIPDLNEKAKFLVLSDKMVRGHLRIGEMRIADPSSELLHSIVHGNMSNAGVQTTAGTKDKACETEYTAPIFIDLTLDDTESPDNILCQCLRDGSQTIISDQNGQGNVPARHIIEERVENSLSKQKGVSPELLEQRSRIKGPNESSEKAKCLVSKGKLEKHYLSKGGKSSPSPPIDSPHLIVDGVRTVEGREDKDCEMEVIAPILTDFTCGGVRIPQDKIPCQSLSERSQAFLCDQNGEENVSGRRVIEENSGNSLTKQVVTFPKLGEPSDRMGIPTEFAGKDSCLVSSDKVGKCYARKKRKRSPKLLADFIGNDNCVMSSDEVGKWYISGKKKGSANLSTESAHSIVDGASSKETEVHNVAASSTPGIDLHVNQILPFKKTLPLWDDIESLEEFQLFPQNPHFRVLENINEYCREGLALGQMVTFSKIVKMIHDMQVDTPRSCIDKCLENLVVLEDNGFDVRTLRDRLVKIEEESQIIKFKKKKRKIDEDVDEIDKKIKELQARRETVMSKIESRDDAIEVSRSLFNSINYRLKSIQLDFEDMSAAPW